MASLDELLEEYLDPDSPSMRHAAQLALNDRAFLRELVEVRKRRGLSQQQVAERLGVSQPMVAKFESYDSNPTLATIRRYAHAVEALVTHTVEADTGQLQDPARRGQWVAGASKPISLSPSGAAPFQTGIRHSRRRDLALAA